MKEYVTSLEVSKKLVEAGWKKETNFWWRNFWYLENAGYIASADFFIEYGFEDLLSEMDKDTIAKNSFKQYPALLVSELLEELKNDILERWMEYKNVSVEVVIDLFRSSDRLAECWLWAKEKGLIKEKRCADRRPNEMS